MTWAAWIVAAAWPVVTRVLAALGIGVITYVGLKAAVEGALSAARGALGGLTGGVVDILGLMGAYDALGILAGALMAVVALRVIGRLGILGGGR